MDRRFDLCAAGGHLRGNATGYAALHFFAIRDTALFEKMPLYQLPAQHECKAEMLDPQKQLSLCIQ